MRRTQDWLRQAEADLAAANSSRKSGHLEWACFIAQQAAEKAVKAAHQAEGTETVGHAVTELLGGLEGVPADVIEAGKLLDRHYIPTRCPNAHVAGAPADLYTEDEADKAVESGGRVLAYVRGRISSA